MAFYDEAQGARLNVNQVELKNASRWFFSALLLLCRKPGVTGRGLYELKPDCLKEYNPFFYHYTRVEQSKVFKFLTFERL